jgi:hypothetical protein
MDYARFLKRLSYPDGFVPPARLDHGDVVATAITRADLADDVSGINASIELIDSTRGGGWPTEPVTEELNYVDLVWHELEFREGSSLTYVLRRTDGTYLGCCYLYPLGRRTELTEQLLDYDVDVSWWVTPAAYDAGYYAKVHDALRAWLGGEFPFWRPYYSNRQLPS